MRTAPRFLFDGSYSEFRTVERIGQTPSKYIKRDVEELDIERYQTIYAKHEGAVRPPQQVFIFKTPTKKTWDKRSRLRANLHVGLGTFSQLEKIFLNTNGLEELIIIKKRLIL